MFGLYGLMAPRSANERNNSTPPQNETSSRIYLPHRHVFRRLRPCMVCRLRGLFNRAAPPLISTPKKPWTFQFSFPSFVAHSQPQLLSRSWSGDASDKTRDSSATSKPALIMPAGRMPPTTSTKPNLHTPPNQTKKKKHYESYKRN